MCYNVEIKNIDMEMQFRIVQEFKDEFYIERYIEDIITMTLFGRVIRTQDLSQWHKVNKYGRKYVSYPLQLEHEVKFKTLEEAQLFIDNFVEYPIYH